MVLAFQFVIIIFNGTIEQHYEWPWAKLGMTNERNTRACMSDKDKLICSLHCLIDIMT